MYIFSQLASFMQCWRWLIKYTTDLSLFGWHHLLKAVYTLIFHTRVSFPAKNLLMNVKDTNGTNAPIWICINPESWVMRRQIYVCMPCFPGIHFLFVEISSLILMYICSNFSIWWTCAYANCKIWTLTIELSWDKLSLYVIAVWAMGYFSTQLFRIFFTNGS